MDFNFEMPDISGDFGTVKSFGNHSPLIGGPGLTLN
jgi:hypothetical protein